MVVTAGPRTGHATCVRRSWRAGQRPDLRCRWERGRPATASGRSRRVTVWRRVLTTRVRRC